MAKQRTTRQQSASAPKAKTNRTGRAKAGDGVLAGIKSAAVKKATGKDWGEWCRVLDEAGAARWTHPAIAEHLSEKCGVAPWWSQMVTVGYEQARGLRAKHQKTDGFSASASKTVGVPLGRLFGIWSDEQARTAWLGEAITVRKATRNKSMRVTWRDGLPVEVNFYDKTSAADVKKSQVTVQHNKLKDAKAVERVKKFWAEAWGRMGEALGV